MEPSVESYHSTDFDASKCMGRHVMAEDRHWTPRVYGARQCSNKPVNGTDLCKTCHKHLEKGASAYKGWHGRVNDNLSTLPPDSHVAGSVWFNTKRANGTLKWSPVPAPVKHRTPSVDPVEPEIVAPAPAPEPIVDPERVAEPMPLRKSALFERLLAKNERLDAQLVLMRRDSVRAANAARNETTRLKEKLAAAEAKVAKIAALLGDA